MSARTSELWHLRVDAPSIDALRATLRSLDGAVVAWPADDGPGYEVHYWTDPAAAQGAADQLTASGYPAQIQRSA